MNKKVGIERCAAYEPDAVYHALKKTVELAGRHDGDLAVAGKTVLLKPNILFDAAPDKALTTHPVFVEAAIRLVREMGAARILVGDSPGMPAPGFSGKACGLGETARKNGAEWVDFSKGKTEVPSPEGKVIKSFTLTQAVREADLIISLPKLKTHQFQYYTGAMKNLFGLIPSLAKSTFHVRFSARDSFASMLVDLNLAVKPAYAFMDAIIGMEGAGPAAGTPRQAGLVLASSNLLALDAAACAVIGYPPGEIPVNRDARGRGFWLSSFAEIEYPGLSPEDAAIPDFVKIPFQRTKSGTLDFFLPRSVKQRRDQSAPGPVINHERCVHCGDCVRICASKVIRFEGEGAEHRVAIDHSRCIRCFCCHEICSAKAIDIAKWRS